MERPEATSLMSHPHDIAHFALQRAKAGGQVALVFVVDVQGGSVREPGLRMAVTAEGEALGYVSNGCMESDVIQRSRAALTSRAVMALAYGRGSGKIDIQLPCGGRVDLLLVPVGGHQSPALENMVRSPRAPGALLVDPGGALNWTNQPHVADVPGWAFLVRPKIRLIVVGAGAEALFLARLAQDADMTVTIVTPDETTRRQARAIGVKRITTLMGLAGSVPWAEIDAGTAIALMFHDHEWEMRVLPEAVASPAFYIGALGSRRAAEKRVTALLAAGCSEEALNRIRAPIGLIGRLRDPNLLAISVLAEIVEAFKARFGAF